MWTHMIINPFCHVPATPQEYRHLPKSSCPLKSPKPMVQKALLLWRSLCLLWILKGRLTKDLPDGGSSSLKLSRDVSDGLVVPRWKGRQKCKSLALDGKEEHLGLKRSLEGEWTIKTKSKRKENKFRTVLWKKKKRNLQEKAVSSSVHPLPFYTIIHLLRGWGKRGVDGDNKSPWDWPLEITVCLYGIMVRVGIACRLFRSVWRIKRTTHWSIMNR